MAFNMSRKEPGEGDFIGYIKYNAKARMWATKPDGGGEEYEVEKMIALMDLAQIKSGWFLFVPGQAPNIVYDTEDGVAPRPSPEHSRGFRVVCYGPKNIGGVREWTATATVCINSMLDLLDLYRAGEAANPGKVPLVECVKTVAVTSKYGTNFAPVFEIKSWHDRPSQIPLEGGKPAAAPAASAPARHAPPPSAPAPRAPADAEVQF